MTFRMLKEKEIETVYSYDMQRDFPKAEIKPLKTILKLRNQGKYQCYGVFENEKIYAYLFLVWEYKTWAMLDYFAVSPKFRGQGIGEEALSLVSLEMKQKGFCGILVEIERISLAEKEEQKYMRTRRKNFYLRAGCRESGLKSQIFGVGYEILYLLLEKKQVNCEKEKADCGKGKVNCEKQKADCGKGKVNCEKQKADCGKGKVNCEKQKTDCEKGNSSVEQKAVTLQEITYAYTEIYHRMVKKEYYDKNVLIYVK